MNKKLFFFLAFLTVSFQYCSHVIKIIRFKTSHKECFLCFVCQMCQICQIFDIWHIWHICYGCSYIYFYTFFTYTYIKNKNIIQNILPNGPKEVKKSILMSLEIKKVVKAILCMLELMDCCVWLELKKLDTTQ